MKLEAPIPGNRGAGCTACGRVFSTDGNFDKHRVGGKCVDPATRGMVQKEGSKVWTLPPIVLQGAEAWRHISRSASKDRPV